MNTPSIRQSSTDSGTARHFKPTIAISTGDPAGIGPEVVAGALLDPEISALGKWILLGNSELLAAAATSSDWRPTRMTRTDFDSVDDWSVAVLDEFPLDIASVDQRSPNLECASASLAYIQAATELCLEGVADAMVTGPVSKEAVALTGRHFTGHTEYIAELCGVEESRMLLVNDRLRVVHVTTHCPLEEVAKVSQKRVFDTISLGHQAVMALGVQSPRIAVCGLNPHAGENGLFGDQEGRVIAPAVEQATRQGIDCSGPLPADTLFLQAFRGRFDLVVAMYHDQGHIPMKLLDFEHTVNISLGLPIIRTSVDHGTAFDIAGKGIADASDMKSALRFAVMMAHARC
ncbi:MAG TPA: 4-hydroxythreonine-4-phosphate dehydrogenase PdxA [Lacipirellulaceae bacterium]|nr:4-hydroxythreonine-4-phosphate dehydrogenase PdxA [Lacipirellulaceae bacterium]HMP06623.1 4-hydroxythreonine-4-phosphate dehydrogenase PdxA [Lacipirellulaceae bacterium]